MPTKQAILEYWKEDKRLDLGSKWDVRTCFACGYTGSLQIHHILPAGHGGGNQASNLHLLCRVCHGEAPHTTDTELYWYWLKDKDCLLSRLVKSTINGVLDVEATTYELDKLASVKKPEVIQLIKKLEFLHTNNNEIVVARAVASKLILNLRKSNLYR